ncbi:MAG: hypothetical protein AB7Q00_04200 [Phycisphaerales bacterium]
MAKMFYTLDETAAKLGKTADQVREMAAKGQLQEFRDRDRLMFKVDQVDLMTGDSAIHLADSKEMDAIGLAGSSGTSMPMESPKDSTGINIFDIDGTDDADANAVTQVTSGLGGFADPGSSGSGSRAGLLDLTREADDTSLGAGLLDDVYGGDTVTQATAAAAPAIGGGDGGALFESSGYDAPEMSGAGAAMAGGMMMVAEPVDGAGSGLVGGLALGAIVALGLAIFATIMGISGAAGSGLLASIGENFMIVIGVLGGFAVIAGVLGWVLGRR